MDYDPSSYAVHEDPYPVYRWMRDERPLYRNDAMDFWALSRFGDVEHCLADARTYSSAHGTQLESAGPTLASQQEMILLMDPPRHTLVRRLVSRAFTPRRVAGLEPQVRQLCRSLLAPVVRAGGGDLVGALGGALPMAVVGMLLGIDPGVHPRIRDLADRINHRTPGSVHPPPDADVAGAELYLLMLDHVRNRRAQPTDDMTSSLVGACLDDEGSEQQLDDHQVTMFCILLTLGGYETTAKLIGNLVVQLDDHRDARSALLAGAPADLAIEESLRYDTPSQYQGRVTTAPVTWYGTLVPAGSRILLVNGAANRDERQFPDPDRFDILRPKPRHLSFGQGPHYCIGANLARLEARVAVEELLSLMPGYRVEGDGVERRHSSNFRGLSRVPVLV